LWKYQAKIIALSTSINGLVAEQEIMKFATLTTLSVIRAPLCADKTVLGNVNLIKTYP
jgi:hypothetical protein